MEPVVFDTPRLIAYRRFALADAEEALTQYGDADVVRYIGNQRVPDLDTMRERIQLWRDKYDRFGERLLAPFPVREKDSGQLVGTALIKYLPAVFADGLMHDTSDIEIGWHLSRTAWGKGYASELGRALLALGFRHHDCDVLHAVVEPPNHRSMAVAKRIGMEHVGQTTRYYGLTLEHFTYARQPA
jgi:[ribosomal protein S5]-alanine N-acetyltransferase